MNKILLNYLLKNFFKTFLNVILIIYSFGIMLNLFEEIEFFKNVNTSIMMPLILTILFVPSMIIKLLPFVIFISSMWFMIKIRNNKDLLTLKVYGYSNVKIFFILAFTSFLLGWLILVLINPLTSSMVKYYEQTKSQYARDIDHLVNFNKNGIWIKENLNKDQSRIVTAEKLENKKLINVKVFQFDKNYKLEINYIADKIDIKSNNWILENIIVFKPEKDLLIKTEQEKLSFYSVYNHEKLINLFNNLDTMSFIDLLINYDGLIEKGYNNTILNQSLHSMLVLPFFLFLMTAIASILTMHTMKKSNNLRFIFIGLMISVIVYYLKDLSIALGKTDRIPLILSIWAPVIGLSLFTFIGVLQINEK
jgi:lipopolysaccharide export system permease protein